MEKQQQMEKHKEMEKQKVNGEKMEVVAQVSQTSGIK